MIKYKSPFKEVQKNISENEIASIVINCAIIDTRNTLRHCDLAVKSSKMNKKTIEFNVIFNKLK
jgi:hypothetical protein